MLRNITILMSLLLFAGCSVIDMKQYSQNSPRFDMYEYFLGETTGWGIVQDRRGNVTRQFVVAINGRLNDQGDLILAE